MKTITLLTALIITSMLSACAAHHGEHGVAIEGGSIWGPGYDINIGDQRGRYARPIGSPRHCPPGHAKKGWC